MNSLTFIILLIIAIAGISSIVWVRKYYDNTAKNMQQNGIKKQTYGNNVQNNKNNIPKTEEIGSILNFNKNKKNEKENIEKSEKVNSEESLSESFKSMFTGERNTNPEEEISTKDFVKESIGNPTQSMKDKVFSEFNTTPKNNASNNNKPASLKKGSKTIYHEVETITPLKEEEKEKFKIEDPASKKEIRTNNLAEDDSILSPDVVNLVENTPEKKEDKEDEITLSKNQTTLTQAISSNNKDKSGKALDSEPIKPEHELSSKLTEKTEDTTPMTSEPMTTKQKEQIEGSENQDPKIDTSVSSIMSEPMTTKQKEQIETPKKVRKSVPKINKKENKMDPGSHVVAKTEKTERIARKGKPDIEVKKSEEKEEKPQKPQKIINEEGVVVLDESDRKDNVTFDEILKDKTYNQPNDDIDEIYEEINNTSYNHTEYDDEIGKSFEGLDDASFQTDDEYDEPIIPIYAEKRLNGKEEETEIELPEENQEEILTHYENFVHRDSNERKIENASNRIDKFYEKLGSINMSKIANKTKEVYSEGSSKISEGSNKIQENISSKNKTEKPQKAQKAQKIELKEEKLPNIETPQPHSNIPKTTQQIMPKGPEKIKVNGNQIELRRGETVIFNHNGETYSSTILKTKPGQIYVTYRKHRIWISTNSIKKKF
ncbi:MAG: hypothetical protein K1X33_05210 [Methanobacteriaceae archaeon]|nr:hypothetical protein [Methanobacteriaceae archaeon]